MMLNAVRAQCIFVDTNACVRDELDTSSQTYSNSWAETYNVETIFLLANPICHFADVFEISEINFHKFDICTTRGFVLNFLDSFRATLCFMRKKQDACA